jgi:hypothetical protein
VCLVTLDAMCVGACVCSSACMWLPACFDCVVEFDLSLADGGVKPAVSKGNFGKGSCCYSLNPENKI